MKIIKKLILIWKYKDIRVFSDHEQDLFYNYVDKDNVKVSAFENNWSYILQATRGQGLKIEKYNSIVYFWLKSAQELIIVHRLGKNHLEIIGELKKECAKLNIAIIVKNVDSYDIPKLKHVDFEIKNTPWSPYSFMDDNTFPQIVCDIQGIINLKASSLRDTHRSNIKRFLKKRNITVKFYTEHYSQKAKDFLVENAKYLENKNVESRKEVYDAHVFFFRKDIKYVHRVVYEEEGKCLGFGFFTVRKGVIYWNALMNRDESNLMLFLLWKGIKYLSENSGEMIEKLALQGCETEGQYKWKLGFYPVEVFKKVHMISIDTKSL